MKPPTKHKTDIQDWTVDDHLRHQRTGEVPVSDDFKRYRADVLRAGGLIDEADAAEPDAEPDLASMTPDQHLNAIRRR